MACWALLGAAAGILGGNAAEDTAADVVGIGRMLEATAGTWEEPVGEWTGRLLAGLCCCC